MPSVTFQCGSCKNLMAVEEHLLGQQVRCPHCQQVLVVPVTGAPTATESPGIQPGDGANTTSISARESSDSPEFHPSETESIFAPPEQGSEDLFGVPTPAAMVEMPAEHGHAHRSLEPKNEDGTDRLIGALTNGSGVGVKASAEVVSSPSVENLGASSDTPQATNAWPDLATSDFPAGLPAEMNSPQLTQRVAQRAKRESLFTTYLIIILIPYAIFATCVAAYFYFRMKQMPHPLEYLRDSGENPPAKRGTSSVMETISPETGLPSRLMLALGQQFRLGDLEIQPVKVERRKLTICSENRQVRPQETPQDALVLTLRLRNVSQDVYFTPTDPVFERQWKLEFGSNRPYTLLDIGGTRFFGGAIKYMPRAHQGQLRGDDPREYVKGQEHDSQALKPGEERTSIFCTDPSNREILKTLKSYQGPLVWRVQLRRGLVEVGDREVSATAVVGVVFDKKDIVN